MRERFMLSIVKLSCLSYDISKDPSQMTEVVKSSISLCSMIYLMTGLFGFLIFGDSTASDILSNFDSDLGVPYSSVLNTMVRLSYAAYIILVFPIVFYPLRLNFDGLMFNKAIPLDSDDKRFALTTLGLLVVIFVGAVSLPSIWVVFQFIGATVGALILFIYPASIFQGSSQDCNQRRQDICMEFDLSCC
ncbi:amino acid transporter AVT6A-like [Silene latifolia]|uniref:amino acid transporter AVT6A-like n=1 Tax=Silene latifolia TaxID=37657 RepID=UPI003D775F57